MLVVMPHIDTEDAFQVASTDDQEMVKAVCADGSHPALSVSVHVRRSNRRPNHLATFGAEDLVKRARELRVAVVDQQPERLLIAEMDHEVARLLCRPTSVRVRRAGDVLDPSRRK